jgi:hypothetical protein
MKNILADPAARAEPAARASRAEPLRARARLAGLR